jgi:hypothetical protein
LRFLPWPNDGILVCGDEFVPRCQIVCIDLDLFYLLIVLSPSLIVVLQLCNFLDLHIVLAHTRLKIECVVCPFLLPCAALLFILLF